MKASVSVAVRALVCGLVLCAQATAQPGPPPLGLPSEPQPEIPIPLPGEVIKRPRPSWPDLEVELPPRSQPRKSIQPKGRKRKEIVVEVGERGGKRRQRRTYRPENLIDDDADAG